MAAAYNRLSCSSCGVVFAFIIRFSHDATIRWGQPERYADYRLQPGWANSTRLGYSCCKISSAVSCIPGLQNYFCARLFGMNRGQERDSAPRCNFAQTESASLDKYLVC